ncbi:DUF7286 family protein [Natronobeatus ordinarius]|uniref:DUF7286 family protein n=1 Tax=Natronobeatus ordinarius TaxID=2963433 RepID=UPI003CE524BF
MTGRNRPNRSISIADDDRARIPFAMIAVLLLVSSVGIIAVLEQRPDPVIDRDAELVLDRSVTAAQSELRTAVLDATHQAGAAPINTTAGSDIDAISAADDDREAFRKYVKLLVYLEAADRLPAAGQSVGPDAESTVSLPPVSSDPGDGEIDPDEAIDRVDLEIGYFDEDVEQGTIHATVHGVEFDGVVGGEELPTETRSLSVSAGSPVFELHERMTEYEAQLNKGFFDSEGAPDATDPDGLGQELALRLYPMAYLKASWDRFGEETTRPEDHAFEEVIDTDHTEVLANHAIFSVQEDVFGTRDPHADRTMRPQYVCTSLDLATTISDVELEADLNDMVPSDNVTFEDDLEEIVERDENDTIIGFNEEVDFEEQVCDDGGLINDWVFGDEATGDLPDVPPLSDLIQDGIESMDAATYEIEVPVDMVAKATLLEYQGENVVDYLEAEAEQIESEMEDREMPDEYMYDVPDGEYERSPGDIVDELYRIDVTTDQSTSSGQLPTPSPPDGSDWERDRDSDSESVRGVASVDVDHTPIRAGDSYDRTIHKLSGTAAVEVRVVHGYKDTTGNETEYTTVSTTDTVDVEVETTIDGSYGFDAGGEYYTGTNEFPVASNPIETDYGHHDDVTFETGFENALVEVTSAESYDTAERDIESELTSALESSDPDGLESAAEESVLEQSSTVLESDDVIPGERQAVIDALTEELETVHGNFTAEWNDDPLRVEVAELTDGETPPKQAIEDIQARFEDQYVDDGGPYETPEEKAKAQIRKAYFDRIYYWLGEFDDEYDEQLDAVESELDDIGDGAGLGYLDDALDFVQGFANADFDPEPIDLEGSPVLDDAQYEVSGSPTYLTTTSINRERDSAIRPEDAGVLDLEFDEDVHHDPMAVQTDNRMPWPGLPVVFAIPNKWYATINTWSVDVRGEYSRFEVSSTIGDPADSDRLTYVAEHRPITVELSDGETVQVGKNEAIDFETETEVIVVMPGAVVQRGGPVPAVADGQGSLDGTTFCSETWEDVGPNAESDTSMCDDPHS